MPAPSISTTPSTGPAVLTASGLTFAWPDGTPVLSGLDLLVPSGRSALVGGASTTSG